MKALPWLRLYTETIDDEKLGLLAFEDRWHFIALLCLKGKGILDSEPDTEMLWRKAALKMGLTVAELEKVVSRLARMKLIDCKTLQPLAWNDRQAQSDSSTERTRKYREKKRTINGKHGGDDAETSQERPSDGLEEDKDPDKEEEIETVTSFKGRGANLPPDAPPAAAPTPATGSACATPKRKTASSTGTRLPDGWQLPKSWGDWALEERPDMTPADVRREADCFADYWHAVPGAKGRKADWQGTWRNWIRRSDGAGPSLRGGRGVAVQQIDPHAPVETYAQRAARQRVEEVAPMAARKAPGQRCGFERAQAFMNGDVIDVTPAQPRIGG